MEKTAISSVQQAAYLCYLWYSGKLTQEQLNEDNLKTFQDLLGSALGSEELISFGEKMRGSEHFTDTHRHIIKKWRHRMEPVPSLSEQESLALIQELVESFDASLIYDHNIIASITHIQRGKSVNRENWSSDRMPCWTLHLTTKGKALFLNNNIELEVTPGSMMLLQPGTSYHYGLHPSENEWKHYWVLFQPRPHWNEWLNWLSLDKGIFHLPLPDSDKTAAMEKLILRLIDLHDDPNPYRSDLQHNRLEEILIRARAEKSSLSHKLPDSRIEKACSYIQTHLSESFNVDDVAAACNLSPSRMAHLFKEQMGISLKAWSNNMRLQQARKLLISSNDSISQIAKHIGYDDPTQFAKNFKRNMGCSPRDFRQNFLNNH